MPEPTVHVTRVYEVSLMASDDIHYEDYRLRVERQRDGRWVVAKSIYNTAGGMDCWLDAELAFHQQPHAGWRPNGPCPREYEPFFHDLGTALRLAKDAAPSVTIGSGWTAAEVARASRCRTLAECQDCEHPARELVECTEQRPEVVAAANWWAVKLAGDPHAAALGFGRRQRDPSEVEAFRVVLVRVIGERIDEADWRPDNPLWGAAGRTIANDYGPNPLLCKAAEYAGFPLGPMDLPLKTTMWINPGEVKVAEGHGAKPIVIWPKETTIEEATR